ncbi:hypothetical protein LCGC14_2268990 [marine sediment metagenome]|uniref:Uncharacterized protein n=1 Tax=marine sediment metagenome TaxID=412755 RepID=A0A0F9CXG6_9ZZZZ
MDKLIDGHRLAILDGRVAVWADTSKCGHSHDNGDDRFLIRWGYGKVDGTPHPEYADLPKISGFQCVGELYPNTITEADAGWEEASQWVREVSNTVL